MENEEKSPNGPKEKKAIFDLKEFKDLALEWRGIEPGEECPHCQGCGKLTYGSTATWRGGVGGRALTVGICSFCWGSGDRNKPWTNLKAEADRWTRAFELIAVTNRDGGQFFKEHGLYKAVELGIKNFDSLKALENS